MHLVLKVGASSPTIKPPTQGNQPKSVGRIGQGPDRPDRGQTRSGQGPVRTLSGPCPALSGPCPALSGPVRTVGQGAVLTFWPPCPIPPKMAVLHPKQSPPPIWHMANTLQQIAAKSEPWLPSFVRTGGIPICPLWPHHKGRRPCRPPANHPPSALHPGPSPDPRHIP